MQSRPGDRRIYIFPRHSRITIGIVSRIHPRNITSIGQRPIWKSQTIAQMIAIRNRAWIGVRKYQRYGDTQTSLQRLSTACQGIPLRSYFNEELSML